MKTVSRVAVMAAALLLVGCKQPFGTRDNPADPGASNYQEFHTVGTVGDLAPESPAEDASILWLSFLCSQCEAADLYGIRLVDSSGGVAYERSDFASNVLELDDASVPPAGTYSWSVRAHEEGGAWGEWSAAASVVLESGVTGPSPEDGASTVDTTPALSWTGATDAVSYEVQVADGTEALEGATPKATADAEYLVPLAGKFAYGDTCYWRVRALNDDSVPCAWSATFAAAVSWEVSYEAVSPADGGSTFDTTPLLDWGDVTGADGYEVQVANSAGGLDGATAAAASASHYQVPPSDLFAYGDACYWRVRALNDDSVPCAWSATFSAAVSWEVSYEAVSPADGGSTFDTTPLLDWADVTGAASYEVQIAGRAGELDAATPVAASQSGYQVPAVLASDTWYWRVRALNDDGVVAPAGWSAAWCFVPMENPEAYALVNGGTFDMGSTEGGSDEEPVHPVTVSIFLISKYEVTQADYEAEIGSNPSYFTGDTLPVEQVSWYDAVTFCNELSASESLDACYVINGDSTTCDFSKNGYRLATEAEWEFAARGGTLSEGYTCSGSNTAGDVGWFWENSSSTTHPVGTKAANELGICDMSGNVWEWCWDWYGSYGADAQTDPTGPTSGSARVLRGGSWYGGDDDGALRCAYRNSDNPADTNFHYGFRVVRRGD